MSAAGEARGLCHQHRRKPLSRKPDPPQPELTDPSIKGASLVIFPNSLKIVTAIIAMVVFLNLPGCKKRSVNPFPGSGEIAGWNKTGDSRVFQAKDLWQYIDGDAEQYVKAGVVSTSTADYNYQARIEAVVDVHTMGSAEGSRKILEGAQARDAHSIQIGDGGVAYAQSVTF